MIDPPATVTSVAVDGGLLLLRGHPVGAIREHLRNAGVPMRARLRRGAVAVDLEQAPKLLRLALPLEWQDSALRLARNRAAVWEAADNLRRRIAAIRRDGLTAARSQIADSQLATRLDDHQAVNVAILTAPESFGGCVFDEQGTGKTVTMIATFDLLIERGQAETVLVIAPKSMVAEWKQEVERFMGDLYKVVVVDGDRRDRARALFQGADVVVMNYEALVALQDEVVRLARRTRVALVVDESFNVKNPDARRTGATAEVREWCTHCFVLCGTPAPNRPEDLVAQFDLVDFGYTFAGLRLDKDPGRGRAQVAARLDERGLYVRNLKSRVLADLPERTFTEVEVDLAPQQRLAYDVALRDLVIDLERVDEVCYARELTSFLARRSALLRICADPTPIVPGYAELPAKVAALDSLLPMLIEGEGEKVILWSFYRASLERLATRYARYGIARVDGSVTDTAERRNAVRLFQEDPDVRLFLGNPAAAGAGLTLHAARYAVYESVSNQAAHYLQSLDRIHRRGQQRDVRYVTLVAKETIEVAEYDRLRTKADAQADLLGDPPSFAPTRRMLLDELTATMKGSVGPSRGRATP